MQINPGAGYNFTSSAAGHNLSIEQSWAPWTVLPGEYTHPFRLINVGIDITSGVSTITYQVESGTINNIVPLLDDYVSGTTVKLDRVTAGVANAPTAKLTSVNYNATTKTSYIALRSGPDATTGNFPSSDVTSNRYPVVIGGNDPAIADTDTAGYIFLGTITVDNVTTPTTFTVSQNVTGSLWADRLKLGTNTAAYYYARI
jgi:hypothetical protein